MIVVVSTGGGSCCRRPCFVVFAFSPILSLIEYAVVVVDGVATSAVVILIGVGRQPLCGIRAGEHTTVCDDFAR